MENRQSFSELSSVGKKPNSTSQKKHPSAAQLRYLRCGLHEAGGKLPLFDHFGQAIAKNTIRSCIEHGWAEPWFDNPVKPDWLVCRLTKSGRQMVENS
jgi:hypothetical protein